MSHKCKHTRANIHKQDITCTHMLYENKQDTILVVVTVTCTCEMVCLLMGGDLWQLRYFSYFPFSFFFNATLPRSSIGTIITLKICRDKIEKSSSLHYLPLQLLKITISKCDFHHLLLIKPRDQIFTKLPELKLLEELRIKLSFHRGTRKK